MLSSTLRTKVENISESYMRDGVAYLPQALDSYFLEKARSGFDWSLEHPTASACTFYDASNTQFYQDLCHPRSAFEYRELLERSPLADIVACLWGTPNVWYLYEQVFVKSGAQTRRTPWHQDSSYLALDGEQIATVWICFDPVAAADSLEFVRGSHKQTLYNGSAFDPNDDTAPIYARGLPRLPDIEADRR